MSKYLGKRFESKYGWLEVIEDNGWNKMVVQFDDGFVTTTARQMIDKGTIKSPNYPVVAGVGFLGEGIHRPRAADGKVTLEYNTWAGMLHRCYDEARQIKERTYINKTVNLLWHNFQNFAEWCQVQVGFGTKGWELDKDLLVKGNLEYGPERCVFIPKDLNIILKSNPRGRYPVGVTKVDSERKFRSVICVDGRSEIIGRFETVEEAFNCYKETKEQSIKERALKYKDSLDIRVFNSLMNWEISIDD